MPSAEYMAELKAAQDEARLVKDSNGMTIEIGDTIMAPYAQGGKGNGARIKIGVVEDIREPSHRGYGYWTCQIKIRSLEDGRAQWHNYPGNCIVVKER